VPVAQVQRHIRENGAVVTRMWVPHGFQDYFERPENKKRVWTRDDNTTAGFNHAVSCINRGGRWYKIHARTHLALAQETTRARTRVGSHAHAHPTVHAPTSTYVFTPPIPSN
jgi:hypothetical protein